MVKATLSYIRYDHSTSQNLSVEIYHIDSTDQKIDNFDNIKLIISKKDIIRQHICTSSILSKDDHKPYEWDDIGLKITGLDSKSGLIILIKSKKYKSRSESEQLIDYYYISNALSQLDDNPNLVYNTDDYYLLEINNRIDQINSVRSHDLSNNLQYKDLYDRMIDEDLIKYIENFYSIELSKIIDAKTLVRIFRETHKKITQNKDLVHTYAKQAADLCHQAILEPLYRKYICNNITKEMYDNPDLVIDIIDDLVHSVRCIPASSFSAVKSLDSVGKLSIHYTI
jgi:hypothetical protein